MNEIFFAQKTIRPILARLQKSFGLARRGRQAEPVHQVRVMSRRLRNMFWVFKDLFPGPELKAIERDLRMILSAFGRARDLDVEIQYLVTYQRRLRNQDGSSQIGTLIKGLREERGACQEQFDSLSRDLGLSRSFPRMKAAVDALSRQPPRGERELQLLVRKRVRQRLKDMLDLDLYAGQPDNIEMLHELRISAKHLRYTLEGFLPLYGKPLKIFVDAVLRLHRLLGSVHDLDVWIQRQHTVIMDRKDEKDFIAAVASLRRHCQSERDRTYQDFYLTWMALKKDKVWKKLKDFPFVTEPSAAL